MSKPSRVRKLLSSGAKVATLVVIGAAETACNLVVSPVGDSGPPTTNDAGGGIDAGGLDAGAGDAGVDRDGSVVRDAAAETDAAAEVDGGETDGGAETDGGDEADAG